MTGARATLRHETRDLHDRVDAVYSAFRIETAGDYGAFLAAQAAAHIPSEAAIDAAGGADILADWPSRRRAPALIADLDEMGLRPAAALSPPVLDGAAAMLGAIYVLEGSRLGGAMLVRSVPAGLPRRFLGATVPGAWRDLMQLIDARLRSAEELAAAVAAARSIFELFERAGQASMKVEQS